KTVWVHEAYLTTESFSVESKTSRLGHLKSSSVRIYEDYSKQSFYKEAGNELTGAAYYIKLQAEHFGTTYFLISQDPSSTTGVVGWVKASDLSTHTHTGVDRKSKNYYLNGKGSAYAKAWGGSKDLTVSDLSGLKDQPFAINLTEKVGNNIWY